MRFIKEDLDFLSDRMYEYHCYETTWARNNDTRDIKSTDFVIGILCPNCDYDPIFFEHIRLNVGEIVGFGCSVCRMKIGRVFLTTERLVTSSVFLPNPHNMTNSIVKIDYIDFWSTPKGIYPKPINNLKIIK